MSGNGQYPMYPQMFGQNTDQQQPYAYNMGVPQPNTMMINGHSQLLPQLSSSMLTPQLNNSMGGNGNNYVQPNYAHGGRVENLSRMAEKVRNKGVGNDKILAHIDPIEAMQLGLQAGGATINKQTGLPQYGFKGLGKIFKMSRKIEKATSPLHVLFPKAGKKLDKFNRKASQYVLPIIGGYFGGPIGAGLGGAAGAALNKKNPYKAGLMSAGMAYGAGAMFGGSGGAMGNTASRFGNMGAFPGMGSMFGSGAGASGASGAAGAASKGAGAMGGMSNMDKFMNGLGIAGMLAPVLGKKQVPSEQNLNSYAQGVNPPYRADQQYRKMKPLDRALNELEEEEYLKAGVPENMYFNNVNPQAVHMAHGGYLEGHTGGQDDLIEARLSDGEFVLPADVVSSLGDGNNSAGAKKLDKFLVNIRKHKSSKGVKTIPPKAKSLMSYMQGRKGA